jgi:hypothetical protein
MELANSHFALRHAQRAVQNATLLDADRKPGHRPSVDATIGIISPAHDRFVGAVDEVHTVLAEDLP